MSLIVRVAAVVVLNRTDARAIANHDLCRIGDAADLGIRKIHFECLIVLNDRIIIDRDRDRGRGAAGSNGCRLVHDRRVVAASGGLADAICSVHDHRDVCR